MPREQGFVRRWRNTTSGIASFTKKFCGSSRIRTKGESLFFRFALVRLGASSLCAVVAFFLLADALLAFGDELLVGGDLLRGEDGFHAGDLLIFDIEHSGMVGIADGLVLGLGVVQNGFEFADLSGGQLQTRLHFGDVMVPKIFGSFRTDRGGGVVAMAESADQDATAE